MTRLSLETNKNDPNVAKATAPRIWGQPKTNETQGFFFPPILKLQSILETVPTSHQILFRYERAANAAISDGDRRRLHAHLVVLLGLRLPAAEQERNN